MGATKNRVVIVSIEKGAEDDVVYELGRALDLSRKEARALIAELPATIPIEGGRGDGERAARLLDDAGAEVRLEADDAEEDGGEASESAEDGAADERGAEASADGEAEEEEEDEEEDEEYDDEEDEDEEDEDEEEEDEEHDDEEDEREARRRRRLPDRRAAPPSQRIVVVGGIAMGAAVLAGLALAILSSDQGCSCGGGSYRGGGASQDLAGLMPQIATRFARGFTPDDRIAHGQLGAGETATLQEAVTGGRCYIWIGLSPDGTDLDLSLREGSTVVSVDEATDNFPVVQHCVAEDATLELEVRMFQGSAQWVVQRFVMQGSEGADQVALLHELYAKRLLANAEPDGPTKRFRLGPGQEIVVDLPMDPAWCYVPLGVSPPGTDLDMFLLDEDGRIVEQDQARDNFPALRHCPTKAGNFKIRLLMFGGEGDAVFRVYRGKLGGNPVSNAKRIAE